jgi:hypothetical protein
MLCSGSVAMTENALGRTPHCPSGLQTRTSQAPAAMSARRQRRQLAAVDQADILGLCVAKEDLGAGHEVGAADNDDNRRRLPADGQA